uniref:Uncharacterized protein n=1 Tax=Glossina pallidipes TaxID=7398 RepID=A0A1A9ZTP2_GLOPL
MSSEKFSCLIVGKFKLLPPTFAPELAVEELRLLPAEPLPPLLLLPVVPPCNARQLAEESIITSSTSLPGPIPPGPIPFPGPIPLGPITPPGPIPGPITTPGPKLPGPIHPIPAPLPGRPEFPEPTADTGDVCEEGEETVRPTLLPMLRLLPLTAAPPTSRLGSNRRSFAATDDVEVN